MCLVFLNIENKLVTDDIVSLSHIFDILSHTSTVKPISKKLFSAGEMYFLYDLYFSCSLSMILSVTVSIVIGHLQLLRLLLFILIFSAVVALRSFTSLY